MDRRRTPNHATTLATPSTARRRHRIRPSVTRWSAVVALLAIGVLGACSASPGVPEPPAIAPPVAAAAGDGYRLLGYAAPTGFTLRIHPSAAPATSEVLAAADDIAASSGITFSVGPPAGSSEPDLFASVPEVVVTVGSYCPHPAVGCARMWTMPTQGPPTIRGVQVSVVASILGQPDMLRAVVLHELGHAVGLDHMPEPFLGRIQVMGPHVDASMDAYRDGDLAGMAAIGAARSATMAAGALRTDGAARGTGTLQDLHDDAPFVIS